MEDVTIHRLTSARVFTSSKLPGNAIIGFCSGREEVHFSLTVAELADLAERLRQDALLLKD